MEGGIGADLNTISRVATGKHQKLLARLVHEATAVCSAQGHHMVSEICFGTMPSGPLSAHVEAVEKTKGYAVFVPSSLFDFLNLSVKLVVLAQPLTQVAEGVAYLPMASFRQWERWGHPYIQFRHYDLLRSVFVYGDAAAALPYTRAIPFQDRFSYLLFGAELFVLAHELGHVVLGHLDRNEEKGTQVEFQADEFALNVVATHFSESGVEYASDKAYLCGFLVLAMVRVWERCVRQILSFPDDAVLDPHHPGFEARFANYSEVLGRMALGAGEEATLPGLLMVHNAIEMLEMLTTPQTMQRLLRDGRRNGGVSGLALGPLGTNVGTWQLPPRDVWNATVAELALSESRFDQTLARWFVLELGPAFEKAYFRSLAYGQTGRERERLFKEAVFALQPRLREYYPRLKERLREEAARNALEEYLERISGSLGVKAMCDYGTGLSPNPMDPDFGRKDDSTP